MNNQTRFTIIALALVTALLAGCTTKTSTPLPTEKASQVGIANPASENCIAKHNHLAIPTDRV